jgi:hypothetical protein
MSSPVIIIFYFSMEGYGSGSSSTSLITGDFNPGLSIVGDGSTTRMGAGIYIYFWGVSARCSSLLFSGLQISTCFGGLTMLSGSSVSS